ncbi:hypothetical protein Lal_00018392 [Lupinus albus]|nr:hypothetical protein Lal_00018392 [Lupinus albus]
MTETDVAQMNTMREVDIRTGKIFGSFVGQYGGYRYIGFSKKDMYNQIQKQRIIGNGDAKSALQYLKVQSKSDCAIVNYHKQMTVFVVDVVSNEIEETYVWLLEAMNGKQPKCVITDGDLSMKNAIKRVFPEAHHKLCVRHICNNVGKNIKKNNFHKDFQKVMYVDVDIDDFSMMREELIAKHGLHNNAWAAQIFDCRTMWARSYIRGKFYVGLHTTSRYEDYIHKWGDI